MADSKLLPDQKRRRNDSDDQDIEGFRIPKDSVLVNGPWFQGTKDEPGFASFLQSIHTPDGKIIACRKMIRYLRNAQLRGVQPNIIAAKQLAGFYAQLVQDQTAKEGIWFRAIVWGIISGVSFLGSASAGAFYTGSLPSGFLGALVPAATGVGVGYGVIALEPSDVADDINANIQRANSDNYDNLGTPADETPTNWPRLRAFWKGAKPYLALLVPAMVFAISFASLFFFPLSFVSQVGDWLSWAIAGTATAGTLAVQYSSSKKSDELNAIRADMENLGELCGVRKIPLEEALGFTEDMGLTEEEKNLLARHIANDGTIGLRTYLSKDQKVVQDSAEKEQVIAIISKIIGPNDQLNQDEVVNQIRAYVDQKSELNLDNLLRECAWLNAEQKKRLALFNQPKVLASFRDARLTEEEVKGTKADKFTALIMALVGAALAAAALFCILSSFVGVPTVLLFTTFDVSAKSVGFFAAIFGTFGGVGYLIYDDANKDINQKSGKANKKMRESIAGGEREEDINTGCTKDAWYKRLGLSLFSYKTIGTFIASMALIANPFTGIPVAVIAIIAALLMLTNILGQSAINSRQAARDSAATAMASNRIPESLQAERKKKLESEFKSSNAMGYVDPDSISDAKTEAHVKAAQVAEVKQRAPVVMTPVLASGSGHHDLDT